MNISETNSMIIYWIANKPPEHKHDLLMTEQKILIRIFINTSVSFAKAIRKWSAMNAAKMVKKVLVNNNFLI